MAPGSPAGSQLGVRLCGELDVLPGVVTLPVEVGPVLEVLDSAGVLPRDPGTVAGVAAGDHVGALGPGGGVVELSLGVASHQGGGGSQGFVGGALL